MCQSTPDVTGDDQLEDTSNGRSGWRYATSKWYLAGPHTRDTSFTYADGCQHTCGERSDELYVQTHTKVPMDDQAAYSNARVTRDEGREANGWRKEEDGEFV